MASSNHSGLSEFCQDLKFSIEGVIALIIFTVGLIGNILSIYILFKLKERTPASFLLRILTISDLSYICLRFLVSTLPSICYFKEACLQFATLHPYIFAIFEPFSRIALGITIWTTIVLSWQRYVAVSSAELMKTKANKQARIQITVVCIVIVILHIPRFMEYDVSPSTVAEAQATRSQPYSQLFKNQTYQLIYRTILYNSIMILIPLVSLLVLTCLIKKGMRTINVTMKNVTSNQEKRQNEERKVTYICLMIFAVFFVCNTPALGYRIMRLTSLNDHSCNSPYTILRMVCQVLFMINASANFFIYFAMSKRFRLKLLLLAAHCGCCNKWTSKIEPSTGTALEHTGPIS